MFISGIGLCLCVCVWMCVILLVVCFTCVEVSIVYIQHVCYFILVEFFGLPFIIYNIHVMGLCP